MTCAADIRCRQTLQFAAMALTAAPARACGALSHRPSPALATLPQRRALAVHARTPAGSDDQSEPSTSGSAPMLERRSALFLLTCALAGPVSLPAYADEAKLPKGEEIGLGESLLATGNC